MTNENRLDSSAVDVTVEREAHPKRWYVARVQMKCERRVAERLSIEGIETYVPTQTEIHQWSDRKKKVERILIPLMVFFRGSKEEAIKVERSPLVYSLLRAPGERVPAMIPDYQIETLKFMLGHADSPVEIDPIEFNSGDFVRIIRGDLRGICGHVSTVNDQRSKVSIVIDYIGCASVTVDKSDLEIVPKE